RKAAEFYASIFPDTQVGPAMDAATDYPDGKQGDELTVEFTLLGQSFVGLNGGPHFKPTEAVSFQVFTDDQAETDRYWNAIVDNDGQESECSWCKDKWGFSWQIVPRALMKAMTNPDKAAAKLRASSDKSRLAFFNVLDSVINGAGIGEGQRRRYRTLLQQDSIARQDVDTQAALVKQLEATIVIDKANEGTARLNLSYTRIVAPIAGRVGLRAVDVGNVVSTSDANGVGLITAISPIDVEFAIPQDQAPMLQQLAGSVMEAKAFDRTRQTVLDTGVFASLDNQVDTQTGTVRAKARFNNAKFALFPSQFVNLQLNVRVIKDAVVVPVSALRHGNTGDYVFVLKEDRTVSLRPVTKGQATVDKVQVATGLQVGERVITEGADRLRDGSRVVLPGDAPGAGGRGQGGGGAGGGGRRRNAEGAASSPQMPASENAAATTGGDPERRQRTRAPAASGTADVTPQNGPAQAPARSAAPAPAPATAAAPSDKPTPEQRKRLLDSAKDDPEQLARRQKFLDAIDKGDPQAVERWRAMQQRRREGGSGS
ncbi:MAG: efflux RND transporter periplasmic adaptor subunit, partial [Pseudomonadota bacterium]